MPDKPELSIVIINSRGDHHGDWVQLAIQSALRQTVAVDVIEINNIGREKTIGQCWNEAVKEARCEWILFQGDDDWIAPDMAQTLLYYIKSPYVQNSKIVNVSSYMTTFNNDTGQKTFLARQHTGAWKKEYLISNPFNEKLEKGVDREYIEEAIKAGNLSFIIEYYAGYFYRKHTDYSCAGDITFVEKPADYYFLTSNRIFLHSITERLAKKIGKENIIISPHTTYETIGGAKVIWVEWANDKAVEIANAEVDAYKILRLHAYEAFSESIKNINLNKFDKVIFIDHYIKDYVERQYGKIENAVVIPNGVEVNNFTLNPNKQKNNKIAYAGYLSRKKGIGELILLAESLPEYEFYCAGRYQEDDIADYFNHKCPKNVHIENWKYDQAMNDFYQDKSFILNTSLRESQGMTMMEASLAGCKPLVRTWLGSDSVYPEKYLYTSIQDLRGLLEDDWNPEEYRQFVIDNYHIDNIYPKLEKIILQEQKLKVA